MSEISLYDIVPTPKLADKLIGTSVGGVIEDVTYNFTLQELLQLFIPNIPANTLQGVLDYGNTATQNINLTGTISTTNLTVLATANILNSNLSGNTRVMAGLFDRTNSSGTAGQVLRSTGTQVEWYTVPTVIPTLQQVLQSGNTSNISIVLTANITAVTATAATVVSNTSLNINGVLRDGTSAVGASNQILSSTGSGVRWVDMPAYNVISPLLYDTPTKTFSIQVANSTQNGYLSSADWINFDGKQDAIILTTTGTSGASTLVGNTLNIPIYSPDLSGYVPTSRTLTINGVAYDLSANRSWTVAAGVASVTATSPLFSSGGADPDISIQVANATQDGYLSATDWTTFNNKGSGTLSSVGVSMPSAFNVANSPLTANGTIAITGAGTTAQYVRGDGTLATFPTIASEAQRLVTEVYNNSGATMTKGTVVYVNGGQGNLPTIAKAIATGDSTSAQTYGVVQNDITNMNNGYVVVIGSLQNIDTQAYTNGTQLYLSSTVAGAWTSVKQYAPAHLVYVGIVIRSHPTQGVVEIRIQNGFEMDELHNVFAQNPNNNAILQYKTSTSLWTSVDGTTTNIAEGTNLYYTDARARGALSLTTTGTSGAATYDNTTGVFNIPQYQSVLTNPVTGTGVAGQLAFWNGTNSVAGDSGLTYNSTNHTLALIDTSNTYTNTISPDGFNLGITTSGSLFVNVGSNVLRGLQIRRGGENVWNIGGSGNIVSTTAGAGQGASIYAGNTGAFGFYSVGSTAAQNVIYLNNRTNNDNYGVRLAYRNAGTEATGLALQNNGNILIGTTADAGFRLDVNGTARVQGNTLTTGYVGIGSLSSGASLYITLQGQGSGIQNATSINTTNYIGFDNFSSVSASTAVSFLQGFYYRQNSLGASATITNQIGFQVDPLTWGTNIYGFRGLIASGSNRWNLYMDGTANNYMAGDTAIGTTTLGTATKFTLGGSETASSAIARGGLINTTLVAAANNDVLVGLDINPTFTNGAFTGVTNLGLRVTGAATISGNLGIGIVPSGWSTSFSYKAIDFVNGAFSASINDISVSHNALYNTSNTWVRKITDFATLYGQEDGNHLWRTAASGAAGSSITWVQPMTLFSTGNLAINTITDAGFRLDVNGTARVQGALTISVNNTAITLNTSTIGNSGGANSATTFLANNGSGWNGFAFGNLTTTNYTFEIRPNGGFSVAYGTLYATTATNSGNAAPPNPNASAVLQADSTTKGFLPPRMTAAQRTAIASPATGLIVYQTDGVEGLWLRTSTGWVELTVV
jgi:hypothetical protein